MMTQDSAAIAATIDIIGPLYDPGQYGADGKEISPPVLLPGWHVNITTADMTPELEPFVVEPSPLRRVWAGDDPVKPKWTVALRFKDEAEAAKVLQTYMTAVGA